jgi:hypothetical protein
MVERLIDDYDGSVTGASSSALLELTIALRSHRDSLVLIGGWVPYFLVQEHGPRDRDFKHVGSIDIDLAVDPDRVDEASYAEIVELIARRGYVPRRTRTGQIIEFSYEKEVRSPTDGRSHTIWVDFLTERGAYPKRKRHRWVQPGLRARMTEGCELAFSHNFTRTVKGPLPDNGVTEQPIRMLDIPGCIGMKGIVLGEGFREKDAYDIFCVVGQCLSGPSAVADVVRPFAGEPAIKKGLDVIRRMFREQSAEGPAWVATFMTSVPSERPSITAEAYTTLKRFIKDL